MDYEKKYKKLVSKIEKAYLYAQTDSTKAVLEEIRLELKESEGEKIREQIISFIEEYGNPAHCEWQKEWIAWLEKQGQVKESEISQHENKTCKENDNSLTCDGFDAELNALLKKYEHLPKEQLLECMNFYVDELEKQWRDEI